MSDIEPLCASTPKKAKLKVPSSNSSYLFMNDDSEDLPNASDNSELLFITSEGDSAANICDSIASKETESILFLSDDTAITVDDTTDCSSPCDATLCEEEDMLQDHSKEIYNQCCKENCLQNFSIEEVNSATNHFQSKSMSEQRQYLHDSLILSSPKNAEELKEKFMLYSKPVCKKAFASLLGTSERRLDRIKQLCGTVGKISHGNQGRKRPTTKSFDASAWMENYFSKMGDHMPDSNRIHLPSFLTKREVYQRMCGELSEDGIKEIISLSTFYELWDRDYNHVLIPEVS